MVYIYATELQSNTYKYIMKYISEVVKKAINNNHITMDDLYIQKEKDIVSIFEENIDSWKNFKEAKEVVSTNTKPDQFYIFLETKKRNVIPLVKTNDGNKRIIELSDEDRILYSMIDNYSGSKYAYVKSIKRI